MSVANDEKESAFWKHKMAVLAAKIGDQNSKEKASDATESYITNYPSYFYERSKSRNYSLTYLSGLLGEREGRKWLTANGYEVYEYGAIKFGFEAIDDNASIILTTLETLRRRRKQEFRENDKKLIAKSKLNIVKQVGYLKGIFERHYFDLRHFFIDAKKLRRKIRKEKNGKGSKQPDFIVKKGNEPTFVEVKVNQAHLITEQIGCFEIAGIYGLKSMVLRVKVDNLSVVEMCLSKYVGRRLHYKLLKTETY